MAKRKAVASQPVKEHDVKAEVAEWAKSSTLVARLGRIQSGLIKSGGRWIHMAPKGTPDFLGLCTHGRILAIECKRPKGGKETADQTAYLDDVRKFGGVAITATCAVDCQNALSRACERHRMETPDIERPKMGWNGSDRS